ncbi:hypothetical protein RHGRI_012426 [Rhododendron griersonianum]|uniref:Uncharacterized protein n=1 Tax=Rhododendron griersonianum TaxID=479676 RepID=A0AAV6KQI2_9ERIC|nr:hypothetical protein RHGRI_012426 [Rhododendron griersonianum]
MYQKLSPPPECPRNMTYGLGYDSVSDDFKVVRAVVSPSTEDPIPVYVFTCKLSSWKRIEDLGNSSFGHAPAGTEILGFGDVGYWNLVAAVDVYGASLVLQMRTIRIELRLCG